MPNIFVRLCILSPPAQWKLRLWRAKASKMCRIKCSFGVAHWEYMTKKAHCKLYMYASSLSHCPTAASPDDRTDITRRAFVIMSNCGPPQPKACNNNHKTSMVVMTSEPKALMCAFRLRTYRSEKKVRFSF